MKKNRIITMSLREIKKTKKRFFSLCVLSFLGISFFVGMKMSGPTMLESLDKYYDNNRIYDLKIVSTLGLVDEDVNEIKKLNKEYSVVGSHTKDAIFNDGKHESVLRLHEINEGMNDLIITEGRMPKKYNEIVVEDGIQYKTDYKIGDKIKLELEDDDESIKTDELEIVGIVTSPEYLNNCHVTQSRGNTNLGNGQVAYYSYAQKDLFNLDYYTEIYVRDNNVTKYKTNTETYLKQIEIDEKQIDAIKEHRQKDRYTKLLDEANNKLKQEEEKVNSELEKAQEQLEQYKTELDNGKKQLDNAKIELDNGKIELNNAKKELDNGNNEIQQGYKELNKAKEELAQGKQKIEDGKKEIENKLQNSGDYNITYDKLAQFVKKYDSSSISINDTIKIFTDKDINIKQVLENSSVNIKSVAISYGIDLEKLFNKYGINEKELIEKTDLTLNEILDNITIQQLKQLIWDKDFIILVKESIPKSFIYYNEIEAYLDEFSKTKESIEKLFAGIRDIENGYLEYNNSLQLINQNEEKLNRAYKEYEDGMKKYNSGIRNYEDGMRKYLSGMDEYNSNLELYNKSVEEFEENKRMAIEEIDLAKEKISKMENAVWYVQTREDNNEYITYVSSYNSVKKLANLFPVIFFLVSIMISLLSMTRMAIEDRGEIGTLKALGFSNNEIRLKYVIYSLFATLIGGTIGTIVGYTIFPKLIFQIFKIMHHIPIIVYSTNILPILIGNLISIICIVGSTILAINNLVREKATTLLRPMAPPIGKKVLIERVTFLWKRFKFSNKLTIRNLFRYKRRAVMSIIGIASCTMILLAGYGLKDSIAYVVDKQYNEINHNDALIALDGKADVDELEQYVDKEQLEFNVYARIDQVEVENKRLSLIIPDDKEEFKKTLTIKDVETKKEIDLKEDSVVVTEKLAKYFNKKVGDTIKILENDNLIYEFTISNICENYIGDYVYMTKDTYKKNIGKYSINTQYLKFKDISKEDEIINNIKAKNPHILSTISIDTAKQQAAVLFKSLNIIIYVIVIFSGALSFVVFYSLTYINMSERKREIATLKVLGYYNREVDGYIMKEEFGITILGILIGLILGTWYTNMLVDSIEINAMQYIKGIHLDSYLLTFGFMVLFTMIVNIGVHFSLKKVNMIDSLKSVE